jgi:hypothetical protein
MTEVTPVKTFASTISDAYNRAGEAQENHMTATKQLCEANENLHNADANVSEYYYEHMYLREFYNKTKSCFEASKSNNGYDNKLYKACETAYHEFNNADGKMMYLKDAASIALRARHESMNRLYEASKSQISADDTVARLEFIQVHNNIVV